MEPIRAEQRKLVGGEIIFVMGRNDRKAFALKGKRVVGVKSIKHALTSVKYKRKPDACPQETPLYSNTKGKLSPQKY